MQRLLDNGTEFVACYADLNHFKPFNDHYGYWRGDQMIRLVARLATMHCDARRDFCGPCGWGRFHAHLPEQQLAPALQNIIRTLGAKPGLVDESARRSGGIHSEDRHGVRRFFRAPPWRWVRFTSRQGAFATRKKWPTWPPPPKHEAKQTATGWCCTPECPPQT